jgi:hypothetical protein
MVHAGKLHVVHVDRRAHSSTCGERYMKQFECVGLHAPPLEPGLDCVEVGLELLGGCGRVTVQGENGCRQQRWLWLLGKLEGPRCI